MANQIQIKRSSNAATPSTLLAGELAYSYSSNTLFIGSNTGLAVYAIGGQKYTDLLNVTGGVSAASKALVLDGSKGTDFLKIANLQIGSTNFVNDIITSTTLTGASNTNLATAGAIKAYVDQKPSNLASQSDTNIVTPANGQLLIYDSVTAKWDNAVPTGSNGVVITTGAGSLGIGLSFQAVNKAGDTVTGALTISNTAAATSTTTGALKISGGVGVAGAIHVGGDAAVGGNMTVGGNLTVSGTTTFVNSTTVEIQDPILKLGRNNTTTDAVDVGFYAPYSEDGGVTVKYAGMTRSYGDNKWYLWDNTTEPNTVANTSGPATLVAAIQSASVNITGGTITGVTISNLAGAIGIGSGGTGKTSWTQNGIVYASATSSLAQATGTAGQILQINDTGVPVFAGLDGGTF